MFGAACYDGDYYKISELEDDLLVQSSVWELVSLPHLYLIFQTMLRHSSDGKLTPSKEAQLICGYLQLLKNYSFHQFKISSYRSHQFCPRGPTQKSNASSMLQLFNAYYGVLKLSGFSSTSSSSVPSAIFHVAFTPPISVLSSSLKPLQKYMTQRGKQLKFSLSISISAK